MVLSILKRWLLCVCTRETVASASSVASVVTVATVATVETARYYRFYLARRFCVGEKIYALCATRAQSPFDAHV